MTDIDNTQKDPTTVSQSPALDEAQSDIVQILTRVTDYKRRLSQELTEHDQFVLKSLEDLAKALKKLSLAVDISI